MSAGREPAGSDAAAPGPGGSADAPEPEITWSLGVDPAFAAEQGLSDSELARALRFTPFRYLLRNDGPIPARRVEVLPVDTRELEPTLLGDLEPGEAGAFEATRIFIQPGDIRVQWFQTSPTARYWRRFELPVADLPPA